LHGSGLDDFVSDVDTAVAQIGVLPVLVGHSMGGAVVQRSMRGRRLPGVVLMASVPLEGLLGTGLDLAMRDPALWVGANLMQWLGPQSGLHALVRRAFFSRETPDDSLRAFVKRMQPESHRAVVELTFQGSTAPESTDDTPTLVLGGEHDALVPPQLVHRTAAYFRTRARILPGGTHGLMWGPRWREAAEVILEWVQSGKTPGGPWGGPSNQVE
jgi:non-heme chloroperoxidase